MASSNHRRALITGASSGIGKATALAFANAGIDVALVGRSPERLQDVTSKAAATGVTAKSYGVDLADLAHVPDQMRAIVADFGTPDILVNNAGMGYTGNLIDTSAADWQQVLDLNLTSVFLCMQAMVPLMRDRSSGIIINVASIAGTQFFPGWGAYSVSKAGLIALSKTAAVEERANGIRVTLVSPGAVNTSIWDTDTVQADFDRSKMLTADTVAQTILHTALLPPGAVIEELTLVPSAGAL
ncbi:MAG: SDR family oxidoreductase [Kaiparowitsia implicata GSE-PSE-MK54-09C]|jgi:NAD(P)-dependent dehydrogenase (short-subunit alcohol dehydrogenase family)|nr:SDR family oxidoreductase [Kaiparowitsia implicata GSE-PSE-MK54-09C]